MNICSGCFNDVEIEQFIVLNSKQKGQCDFCSNSADSKVLDIAELLDFFSELVSIFKIDTSGQPLCKIIQDDWNLFSSETNCQKILEEILPRIDKQIKSSSDSVSYIDEIIECVSYWDILKENLKWKFRYLNDIDRLIELRWDSFFNRTIELSPKQEFYRARIHFKGEKSPFTKTKMGSPKNYETKSGRANPLGIPYLYLSKSIDTTLYETRATYLDDISIGIFKIKRGEKIIIVDFTEDISCFLNIGNLIEYTKSMLLKKKISLDLSKPIRRYDSELEYIPTQFICEFIRYITGAEGIIFNSSLHKGGKNIVLFEQEKIECFAVELHSVTKVQIESTRIKNAKRRK
jgi:hypothetical protein